MKLRLRFIFFFVGGLIIFIMLTGMFVLLCSEYLIPILTDGEESSYILDILSILLPFIIGGILFGLFFVNPLAYMISLIRKLTSRDYILSDMDNRFYKQSGKLKACYFLYRELISDIYVLANELESTEKERKNLEEAKTNWIAGVSHDLKTPLSYITGYSALLLDSEKGWTATEQAKFSCEIHDKSVIIKELIDDLNLSFKLDTFGESYPLNKQKFNIVDFAKRLLADIANNPKAMGYDFSFQSNADVIQINADEKLLYRAIQNVIMNAVLHNTQGTSIEIDICLNMEENCVSFTITDNGVGMNKNTIENIFARYYRPDENENVSGGLGLSVVKNIIEAHSGTINVRSEKGGGTTVEIILLN